MHTGFRPARGVIVTVAFVVAACGDTNTGVVVEDAAIRDALFREDGQLDAGPRDAAADAPLPDAPAEAAPADAGVDVAPVLPVGAACRLAGECTSGFCVDRVCCGERCDGVCERCDLAGHEGICGASPAGEDPDDECAHELADGCGHIGSCNGSRACAWYPEGTVCGPAECIGQSSRGLAACDGAGSCRRGPTVECAPSDCDPATGLCAVACTETERCPDGLECVQDKCLGARGVPCSRDAECATGFCTDGVCCERRCDGVCERCALAGREGFCDPVPAGTDLDDECSAGSTASCGLDGMCSGQRACRLYGTDTICEAPTCLGAIAHLLRTCDGAGSCGEGGTQACEPYACDSATGACRASCTGQEDCVVGYECRSGTCKKSRGGGCAGDGECASGFCTDGVCCETRCHGLCEQCDASGRIGTCDAIAFGRDPDDECPKEPASTCGRTGGCSGTRRCALHAAGVPCSEPACVDETAHLADTCDGSGACIDGGSQRCFPYTCNGAAPGCNTSCATDAQCQAGYTCANGVCKKSRGGSCVGDGECASGFCTEGVCCDGRCDATCEACNQAGRLGYCDPIPEGTDPDGECATEALATCGRDGFCSGNRSCRLYPSGTECAAASCSPDLSAASNRDTCDGSGVCVDNGTQACSSFICNSTTGRCHTACSSSSECAIGYECHDATAQCLKALGTTCGSAAECLSGACCAGVCVDPQSDLNHCGACDSPCTNPHGTTACTGGACVPTCSGWWKSCDNNASNGCERAINTLSDCGDCGVACSRPNATATCSTGTCALSACNGSFFFPPYYSNCDGIDENGCELNNSSSPNTIDSATDVGSSCGNDLCGFFCGSTGWTNYSIQTGRTSKWFKARVNDCSFWCDDHMTVRITLYPPVGTNYDLWVYTADGRMQYSGNLGNEIDVVEVTRPSQAFSDNGFDVWVKVQFAGRYGGNTNSCENWSVKFDGRTTC